LLMTINVWKRKGKEKNETLHYPRNRVRSKNLFCYFYWKLNGISRIFNFRSKAFCFPISNYQLFNWGISTTK
jgi:hypothetical protein